MKSITLFIVACLVVAGAQAQEYKVAKSTGRLEIHTGRVTVEGHAGKEIIFTSRYYKGKQDSRADGLRAINASGLEDNTGLGVNVTDKGNVVEVWPLKRTDHPDIKILVPKTVIVSFEHQSQYGGDAVFRNMENEIEVSATYNNIELDNVTGPLTIKSIYGGVDARLNASIKSPISIVSVYGHVDVTMPASTKADLKLSTSHGEILVSPEFKIDIERKGSMVNYSDKVSGKINGGGIQIDLTASYGKIYLRNTK